MGRKGSSDCCALRGSFWVVACKLAAVLQNSQGLARGAGKPSPLEHTPVRQGTERPLYSTDLGGALGQAQPPAPFPTPSGLPRRPPARDRPDNAPAARSSDFFGPTREGERQGGASREPGLARGRSPLLQDTSLSSGRRTRQLIKSALPGDLCGGQERHLFTHTSVGAH